MHCHDGVLEICFVHRGHVTWRAEGRICPLVGGEVLCIAPGRPHGGHDGLNQPSSVYWLGLQLSEKLPEAYLSLPREEALLVYGELAALPTAIFPATDTFASRFDRLVRLIGAPRHVMAVTEVRAALLGLVVELIRVSRHREPRPKWSEEIASVIELMRKHVTWALSIEDLADRVGWSPSHLKARFRREVGMPPAEFYLRHRVECARQEIMTTQTPLARVAQEYGFGSSQYLATCFRRITGRSPSSYRAARTSCRNHPNKRPAIER